MNVVVYYQSTITIYSVRFIISTLILSRNLKGGFVQFMQAYVSTLVSNQGYGKKYLCIIYQ